MATGIEQLTPQTLPITVPQYRILVDQGVFEGQRGQIELINGRIVRMNPQGPIHSDPIDELESWSHQVAGDHFRIRIEKPIEISQLNSSPEPDIVWATRRRYFDRHPTPADIHLLIEVSASSRAFDRSEKLRLYAEADIVEYWIVDIASQSIEVFTLPQANEYQRSHQYVRTDEISRACLPTATLAVDRLFSDLVQ